MRRCVCGGLWLPSDEEVCVWVGVGGLWLPSDEEVCVYVCVWGCP